jgi:hypothetical protein
VDDESKFGEHLEAAIEQPEKRAQDQLKGKSESCLRTAMMVPLQLQPPGYEIVDGENDRREGDRSERFAESCAYGESYRGNSFRMPVPRSDCESDHCEAYLGVERYEE